MTTDTINTEATTANAAAIVHEGDVEGAALTQGATQVQLPQGENVVRIQVTPGETIQLPFAQDRMVARLDDGNGNLAVRVGDITVILQGYAAAQGEADVNLIDSNGNIIDVALVVAATDPDLDIETAAGPAAGAPGAGVDNNGGVFSPFDPAAGIGGLNGLGGLDPTALNYRLIQREAIVFEEDEEEEVAVTAGSTPVVTVEDTFVNEDDLQSDYYSDFKLQFAAVTETDGNDHMDNDDNDTDGPAKEPTANIVKVTVDYGADLPANPLTAIQLLIAGFPPLTSNGETLDYIDVNGDGSFIQAIRPSDQVVIFEVEVDSVDVTGSVATYDIRFSLVNRLDHPDTGESPQDQDLLTIPVSFQVTDSNGTIVDGSFNAVVKDDVPTDLYIYNANESGNSDQNPGVVDEDEVNASGNPGTSENGDDNAGVTASGWISVSFGADGPADTVYDGEQVISGAFTFDVAAGSATGLKSLGGDDILFGATDAVHIFGYVDGENAPYFEATLDPQSGYWTFTLLQPIQHPAQDDGDNENGTETAWEDNVPLIIGVKATDDDGDFITSIISISIDDDRPTANDDVDGIETGDTVATGNVLTGVDIGAGEDDNKSDGVADVTGADDGAVSKLEGETTDADGSDGFSVDGKYGTLVMDKDGNYTYTLNPNAVIPDDAQEVFTYTLTDGDGDSDTATLTISVPETIVDRAGGSATVSGCVAEDLQPGQWSGDQTEAPEALSITFTPADNETVTGASIDIPAGWSLQVWDTSGGGSELAMLAAGVGVDIDPYINDVLSGAVELRPVPPADSDVDGAFTLHLDIQDPDSLQTGIVDQSFTVYLDAVADKPTNVSISISDDGYEVNDKGSKITEGVDDGVFIKNETGSLLVTANFSDTDGSEAHTVRVDLPTVFSFQNLPANIPGVDSWVLDGNDLVLTLSQGTTSFSYEFDIIASGLAGNNTHDAYASTDPFKVTAKAVETPTDGGCGPGDTDVDPNSPDGALDNQSTTIATLSRPNILNGEFVTNTNVQKQVALVTFVDQQDPLRAYAQLVVRGSQGQQGAILADAGFLIDPTHDHLVGAEATAGTKVIITDLTLEGVRIVDPGNAQVEVDNNPTGANEGTAIVTTINPDGDAGVDVGFEYSKDDPNAGGNGTLTDTDAATVDYVFGGAGGDTITASNNGTNILNGGDILDPANNGADTIIGGSGTDVLVFDPLDTLNGGAGFDIVRVDQGAIFNTMTAEGLALPAGLANATVDMRDANITNVESILITEEASPSGAGTKIILNASDVIDFADNSKDADGLEGDTLYVIGSNGDSLELHLDGGVTVNSTSIVNDDARGMTFTQYNLSNGGTLIVDSDVTVSTVV